MAIGLSTSFSAACRVSREHSTTRRFINYLSNEASKQGDKKQHLMQMRLCTTIITNISWFLHVFAGRPGVRGPTSMLAGLWQRKLRVIWWLIKWQSNTCMDYEIAAWMGLVSSLDEWRWKKENVIFLSSITQFRGPGTQKPIHPIVIHENEILARDRDRSISLEISLVRRDFNSICTTIRILFPLRRPRRVKMTFDFVAKRKQFRRTPYRHMEWPNNKRPPELNAINMQCDLRERRCLLVAACFEQRILCGGT